MVKVRPRDLQVLLRSTFRYSLGRMTYMPGLIQGLIREHRSVFDDEMLLQMAEEIEAEHKIRGGRLGMDFDTRDWMNFRDWLRESVKPTSPSPKPQE